MGFNLQNKRVTIIGAARSGIAVADAVCRLGGMPKISEAKSRAVVEVQLKGLRNPQQVDVEYGGHTQGFIQDSDYVVISPGIRADHTVVQWARAAGIEVMGEIEFSYRLCPCPIIAVTGSNGKTTTSTLIAKIITQAKRTAVLCGNIGSPFAAHVLDLKPTDTVVLETSSFQLESTVYFKPQVALWLNFSQNHLDRHKDLEEYFDAKARIFANQDRKDWAVLNAEQPEFKDLSSKIQSRVIFFNGTDKPADIENPNFLAALAVAKCLDIGEDVCRQVFEGFKGVEHRLEKVRSINGVDYINDSKSTTVEAGRWALNDIKKPLLMICGGSDKHSDFYPLRALVKQKVNQMIVYGQTKEILRKTFEHVVPVEVCESLPDAVDTARRLAKPGNVIVLSPMCASFDMFKDYEHRGRVFKEIVMGLK